MKEEDLLLKHRRQKSNRASWFVRLPKGTLKKRSSYYYYVTGRDQTLRVYKLVTRGWCVMYHWRTLCAPTTMREHHQSASGCDGVRPFEILVEDDRPDGRDKVPIINDTQSAEKEPVRLDYSRIEMLR